MREACVLGKGFVTGCDKIPPKEEESDSQDVVKKETKKDDLNKEVRDALTRKAGAPSQISLHSS
jgi:hypothetical protein